MVDTSRTCPAAQNDVVAFVQPSNQDITAGERPDAVLVRIQAHVVALGRLREKEQPTAGAVGAECRVASTRR
jgi:hypothetical protein